MKGLPEAWRARLASLGLDRAWPLLVASLLVLAALAVSVGPAVFDQPTSRQVHDVALPESAQPGQLAVTDTDNDGLPDAMEAYVYGTDPEDWDSTGTGIPDGYFTHFGYNPQREDVEQTEIQAPPAEALPPGYNGTWPERYQLTLQVFYELTRPADHTPGEDDPWWKTPDTPSPKDWDKNDDGIADAWFVVARLDPYDTPLDQVAPGSQDTLTVAENWQRGTDPSKVDTDEDGLTDVEEPSIGTDPARSSTLEAGVADGWLVGHGLDPLDPGVLFVDPDKDGLTTAEEFRESRDLMPNATVDEILDRGLDPFAWDTSGDGIPDGWLIAHGLDPMDPSVGDEVTERASDHEGIRFVDDAPADKEPLGDLALTVRDEYQAARPAAWNESTDGVWWGGTSPATNDTDQDGLPDALEVRGWYVQVTVDKGPAAQATWEHVTSNPSRPDTDGDGLNDLDEHRGQTTCDDETRSFPATHPERRDTAFSGLTDRETICGFEIDATPYDLGSPGEDGLDPTMADTDGDLIADGPEAEYWHERAQAVGVPYPFADTAFASSLDVASGFPTYAGASSQEVAKALSPDGDWDGDGLANLLDPDSASGLALEGDGVCEQGSEDPEDTFLLDGPQIDPTLYRFTDLATRDPRPATDPANPDTDGDGLPDAWEVRFGRYVSDEGRWSLDPTLRASAGGTSDGQANLDDDVITYVAPPDTVKAYEHDNLQECRSGTDPHALDSDDGGLSDGWKVFWGLRYVDLVSSSDPVIGELTDQERSTILERAGQVSLGPGQTSTGTPPWWTDRFPVPYTRYVPLAEGGCDQQRTLALEATEELEVSTWERLPADPAEASLCIVTAENQERALLPIKGTFNATFPALFGTGANPYLDDADRDGAMDWIEVLHAKIPGSGDATPPSPLEDDGDRDADGDGLTLAEEADAWGEAIAQGRQHGGPDPTLADSDHDGLSDADEVLAGFDPKDPRTIENLGTEGGDADGDGIDDLEEIKGWSHDQPPPLFKTSPIEPDTDGDGLVDNLATADGIREELDRAGVARVTRDGETRYLGEGLYGSDPTKIDTSGEGVPDGWQAYYQEELGAPGPTSQAPGLVAPYEAGKPLWWEEETHGVWWWGMPPVSHMCSDLDGDGLSDTNGEDPFSARADNTYTHGTFETTDPDQAKAYILSAPTPAAAQERAQAWGPEAGDPLPTREDLLDGCPSTDRPDMRFSSLELTPDTPVLGGELTVTGRVLGPDGQPVQVGTVLVSLLAPSVQRAVGVAFTGTDGSFTMETTVKPDQSAVVPGQAILLGSRGTEVSWTADLTDVSPGETSQGQDNQIVVWAYNTTQADGAQRTITTPFEAATQVSIDTAEAALVGQAPNATVTLEDGLGNPLAQREVAVTWDATQPPIEVSATTDAGGQATLQLPAPTEVGTSTLTATFDGDGELEPTSTSRTLPVQRPVHAEITAEPETLTAGEQATISGQLSSSNGPVAQAPVDLTIAETTANATTGPDGRFELTVTIPTTAPPGDLTVLATYPGDQRLAPAEASTTLEVLATVVLKAPSTVTLDQASGGLIQGQVVDARGRGVLTTVTLQADGLPTRQTATDEGGWTLSLPADLPRGQHAGTLTAKATEDHTGDQHPITLTIRSPGHLDLDPVPGTVEPGTTVDVTGTLTGGQGDPAVQEGLFVQLLDLDAQVLTDQDGRFETTLPVPEDAPLGQADLQVTYTGDLGGSLTPVEVNRTLMIKEPTTLTLATVHTPMDSPRITGHLATADGEPLPGETVTAALHLPGQATPAATATATTTASGNVTLLLPGDLAAEATRATVNLTYPGSASQAPDQATGTVNLTTPLAWEASLPSQIPLETTVAVTGTVYDAQGPPIETGTVTARLAGTEVATGPVTDGRFELPVRLPPQIPPGQHDLVINLDPPGLHAATPLEGTVTVTTLATVEVTFDQVPEAGSPYQATAKVTDQAGRPLANTTLVYWLEDGDQEPVAATARTNETGHATLAGASPGTGGTAELTVVARGPMLTREAAVATSTPVATPGALPLVPALLATALVAAVGTAIYMARRRREQVSEVQEIVDELIHDLEMGNEYQAVVLLAYKKLQDHLESYGFLDQPDYTAREFLDAVRQAMPLPEDDVEAFVDLFEQARYSQHALGPRHRVRAISKLREIQQAIGPYRRGASL